MSRAQSQYISWILIIAMIVAVSIFLYRWSIDQAQKSSEEIERRTDPVVCSDVGITIEGS